MHQPIEPARSYADFPPVEFIPFGELLAISLSASTNDLTHGLHRYPAKYIPQIPRWAIREFSREGDTVLDPFSGSGTTIVEALAEGRTGIGVDLDPLACLIAEAKSAALDPAKLEAYLPRLLATVGRPPLAVPLPDLQNFGHWFSEDAWRDLQALRRNIDAVATSYAERRFLLVIFSSIIRAVSNADDQSQKTYVSGTLRKEPPSVLPTFEKHFIKAMKGMKALNVRRSGCDGTIHNASATNLPIKDASVDLVVTSPPYLDSVDYMYNLMLEYFWLGTEIGVNSRKNFNALRRKQIGAKSPLLVHEIPDGIRHLFNPEGVAAYRRETLGPYFAEMSKHFHEAHRVIKPGGRYVLVIGNSRTQNEMLRLHDALIALASAAGLHIEHAFGYRIRRHYMKFPRKGRGGIILTDWVITLRKGGKIHGVPTQLPHVDLQLPPAAVAH